MQKKSGLTTRSTRRLHSRFDPEMELRRHPERVRSPPAAEFLPAIDGGGDVRHVEVEVQPSRKTVGGFDINRRTRDSINHARLVWVKRGEIASAVIVMHAQADPV